MKKRLTPQNTEQKKKAKEIDTHFEEYFDFYEYKRKHASGRFFQLLAQKLIHWSINDPKAYKMDQFWLKEGIVPSTGKRWCREIPEIDQARTIAVAALGCRREAGAIDKEFEPGMIKHMMPMYDQEWREIAEWQAKMRVESEGNSGTQIVVIEKIPDSDLVPYKNTPEQVAAKIHSKTSSDKFTGGK